MRKEVVEWLQVAGWRQSAECSSSAVRAGVSWNLQMMRVPAGRETRRGTDALAGCLASLLRCDGRSGGCAAFTLRKRPRGNLGSLRLVVKTGLRVRRDVAR